MGKTFKNKLVFTSASPDQHHQLVIALGRPADAKLSTVMQLSFAMPSIQSLRDIWVKAEAQGATEVRGLNHGNVEVTLRSGDDQLHLAVTRNERERPTHPRRKIREIGEGRGALSIAIDNESVQPVGVHELTGFAHAVFEFVAGKKGRVEVVTARHDDGVHCLHGVSGFKDVELHRACGQGDCTFGCDAHWLSHQEIADLGKVLLGMDHEDHSLLQLAMVREGLQNAHRDCH